MSERNYEIEEQVLNFIHQCFLIKSWLVNKALFPQGKYLFNKRSLVKFSTHFCDRI